METRDFLKPALEHLAVGFGLAVANLERKARLHGEMITLATGHTRLRYILAVGSLGQ